jgi:uncharacterized protein YbjT (DUF2867 family)
MEGFGRKDSWPAEVFMSKKTYVVTGATGNIGKALTERLLAGGHAVRAIARGIERLHDLAGRGAETYSGFLDDPGFLTKVMIGADGVFAMLPPNFTSENLLADQRATSDSIAAAIRHSGVKTIVALSSVGAQHESGTGPIAGLHYHEQNLTRIPGANVVALRPASFMENFLQSIGPIRTRGVNGSPIKRDLPMPMVATRDIAAAAASHLTQDIFQGNSIHYLLGPADLTMAEATRTLGEKIGKPNLPYFEFSYEDARKALLAAGFSQSVAEGFVEMYKGFNDGLVSPTEHRSALNMTPTTLEEWSATFAAAYRAAEESHHFFKVS